MYYLKEISYGTFSDLSSRFECALIPLSSKEALKQAQEDFKAAFPKADHYPYAFCYDGLSRSSDDGEPSGTGGRALLSLLEQRQIDRCLIIVARYFGGTKLGVPRLRRAFVSSGEAAISHATLYIRKKCYVYELNITYSEYSILQRNASRYHFTLRDTAFEVNVLTKLHSFDTIDASWEKLGLQSVLPVPKEEEILLEEES